VKEAHDRDLKVITELVINHTSDQHPWFKRAIKAPKGSAERDFYVWSDDPNQWSEVRIIFEDFETSNWQWHGEAQQYYWHRFFHHQPDLNFDSPDVQQAVKDVLDFWAELGVDGMRLDAIPYLFVRDGHERREPAGDPRLSSRTCAATSTGTRTGCSWPRPTSGPRTPPSTSATATNAT
jgi:maltose alpha-D-glucosyltransferase / alpha-amylase